jgi:peptide deformylase
MNFRNPIVADYLVNLKTSEGEAEPEHTHDVECDCEEGKLELLPLVYFPSDFLKQACLPIPVSAATGLVSPEVVKLAKDMVYTMMVEGGVGLAAPQIGKLLRIFVVDIEWKGHAEKANPHIFINPVLEPFTEELDTVPDVDHAKATPKIPSKEGCLSFPGGFGSIERYNSIRVKYLDIESKEQVLIAKGFFARAIQHEYDHLDGKTIQSAIPSFDMRKVRDNIKADIRKKTRVAKPTKPKVRRR